MTISKPESTSTGGLENQQITFQIDLGVSRSLDSVSLSALYPTSKLSLSHLHRYLSLRVSLWEVYRQDIGLEEREVHPPSENEDGWEYEMNFWLWEYIKHTAILRFFEIWGDTPMPSKRIYSGLGASEGTKSSVSGMISILSQDQSITKDEQGKWAYTKNRPTRKQYRYRDIFPDTAIRRCKEIAFEHARNRKAAG